MIVRVQLWSHNAAWTQESSPLQAFILGPQDGLELIESTFGSEGTLQTSTRKLESRSYHAYLIQEAS